MHADVLVHVVVIGFVSVRLFTVDVVVSEICGRSIDSCY